MTDTDIKETKDYEVAFLAKDERGKEAVQGALRRAGGEVLLEGPSERIPLAYPVRHEAAAYFGYVHVRLVPSALAALNHELTVTPDVLRHLIVTPPFSKMRQRTAPRLRPQAAAPALAPRRAPESLPLSNEELSRKIEEILK
jgi:ribosomal protein S6